MEEIRAGDLEYFLIVAPDTSSVEREVNRLLQKHPDKMIAGDNLIAMPYHNKRDGRPGTLCVKEIWLMRGGRGGDKKDGNERGLESPRVRGP